MRAFALLALLSACALEVKAHPDTDAAGSDDSFLGSPAQYAAKGASTNCHFLLGNSSNSNVTLSCPNDSRCVICLTRDITTLCATFNPQKCPSYEGGYK